MGMGLHFGQKITSSSVAWDALKSSACWDGPHHYKPRHHEACSNFEVLMALGVILKAETHLFAAFSFFLKVGGFCLPTETGTFTTLVLRLITFSPAQESCEVQLLEFVEYPLQLPTS